MTFFNIISKKHLLIILNVKPVERKGYRLNHMKRKSLILLITILSVVILVGCKGEEISNEFIIINQYIGLEVTMPTDENNEQDNEKFEREIWEAVLDNCIVIEFQQGELESLIQEIETQYSYVTYFEDKNVSDLIEELHGMTVEEFAKEELKKRYAIELIAENENLLLSDKDYNRELEKRARENEVEDVQQYENMFGREQLYRTFLEERVLEFIKENLK